CEAAAGCRSGQRTECYRFRLPSAGSGARNAVRVQNRRSKARPIFGTPILASSLFGLAPTLVNRNRKPVALPVTRHACRGKAPETLTFHGELIFNHLSALLTHG